MIFEAVVVVVYILVTLELTSRLSHMGKLSHSWAMLAILFVGGMISIFSGVLGLVILAIAILYYLKVKYD